MSVHVATAPHPTPEPGLLPAPLRARGRPRKTLLERDDGNRRAALLSAAASIKHDAAPHSNA